jgi:hypothetical protein
MIHADQAKGRKSIHCEGVIYLVLEKEKKCEKLMYSWFGKYLHQNP